MYTNNVDGEETCKKKFERGRGLLTMTTTVDGRIKKDEENQQKKKILGTYYYYII